MPLVMEKTSGPRVTSLVSELPRREMRVKSELCWLTRLVMVTANVFQCTWRTLYTNSSIISSLTIAIGVMCCLDNAATIAGLPE